MMFWKNQIVIQLKRIADALEKQIDLSAEDKSVREAAKQVQESLGKLSHKVPPKQ